MRTIIRALQVITCALILAGCGSLKDRLPIPSLTTVKHEIVMPDDKFFVCPQVTTLPDYKTLTDSQVAGVINELWEDNQTCTNNIMSLKDFLTEAQKKTK